jgi:uncharacterized RDD family membrane protein YckC
VLADVDVFEDTEEQFASSVAGMDEYEDEEQEQELSSGTLAAARERYAQLSPASMVSEPMDQPESWRDEVANRLQNYKARRKRSLGDESLSFNFESTAANHVFLRPEVSPEADIEPEAEIPPSYYAHNLATAPAFDGPVDESESMDHISHETQGSFPQFETQAEEPKPAPETAKLILFPRASIPQEPPRNELADPVFDKPRIVEAADTMQTIAVPLADITLRPDDEDEFYIPYIENEQELPVTVALRAQRMFGELVDVLLVVVATGLFATVVSKIDPTLLGQDRKTTFALAVLIPAIFWWVYKYLFLVYHGATIGMQLARMQLVDLDGNYPTQGRRRSRALAMLVSIFPLGLGLMWSFVDQDQLCWHDRISRTYLISAGLRSQNF